MSKKVISLGSKFKPIRPWQCNECVFEGERKLCPKCKNTRYTLTPVKVVKKK